MADVKKKKSREKSAPHPTQCSASACELCTQAGGKVLWHDKRCRVVLIADPDYAGYCRVIWNAHVQEMTDLTSVDRRHCMRVVLAVERVLRNVLQPHKINLASFGNMTPHLHWHVIPRNQSDAHFPDAIWGKKQRRQSRHAVPVPAAALRKRLAAKLLNLL